MRARFPQLRENAETDVQFAQRVAMACCALVETKVDGAAAIRTTFRIQEPCAAAFS